MNAESELLAINIEEEYFPPSTLALSITDITKFSWSFTYSFGFSAYKPGFEQVKIIMSFEFLPVGFDNNTAALLCLEISTIFKVTAGLDFETKFKAYGIFFHLTSCNIQGIYAAKVQGTPMASIIPPSLQPDNYKEELLKITSDG